MDTFDLRKFLSESRAKNNLEKIEKFQSADPNQNPEWKQQLPKGIEDYAKKLFRKELEELNHPDIIVLPLTKEGEEYREWLYKSHHNELGDLVHQSIGRYGATEHNFEYKGDTFLAILIDND